MGVNFFAALGSPEILGPDFCPFHTALATGQSTSSMLRSQDNRYFQVHAAPMRELNGPARHLIVTVRNVTYEVQQQQKIAAIHQAGMELADLTPEELFHMPVKDRIELLKANIAHFTKDLLNFEVVEVRLLDRKTNRLEPLLGAGHDDRGGQPRPLRPAAEQRRDRLRGGHRQELPLRGHHRGPALPRRRPRGQEFLDRPAVAGTTR